jgi:tetratricopeptide (TPR) repeat protein
MTAPTDDEVATLINRAFWLCQGGQLQQSLPIYDDVISRTHGVPGLERAYAKALSNKGQVLNRLLRPNEALKTLSEFLRRFGDNTDPMYLEDIAGAMLANGMSLGGTGRPAEAVHEFNALIQRFGKSTDAYARGAVAWALHNRAVCLGMLARFAEARAGFEQVLSLYGHSQDPNIQEVVARTRMQLGLPA